MMTQKKMGNDLFKFLIGKFLIGKLFNKLSPKEIKDKYGFIISQEDLSENYEDLLQTTTTVYISSQLIEGDKVERMFEIGSKIQDYFKTSFNKSKYSNLNKVELEELLYIYNYKNEEFNVGSNLIKDDYERCAVYFYYLSKYIEGI